MFGEKEDEEEEEEKEKDVMTSKNLTPPTWQVRKNEKIEKFESLQFWRFEPCLANLIWTNLAKTEAHEKREK